MSILLQAEETTPPVCIKGRHIALYMQAFTGGGAERVMVNLAAGLAARGHRVDMVVVQANGPYLTLLPPAVRLIDLRRGRSLASLPGLIRYLRRERPDALLSAIEHSNLIAVWAGMAARYRGRLVVSSHINLSTAVGSAPGFRGRVMLSLCHRFYTEADAVVAVSQEAASDLTSLLKLPEGQVRMIYNPVITPALFEQAQEPVGHPWFEAGQPPVVLSVGRLCPQKDFPTLIRAFAQFHERTNSRLMILGEGPERPTLERMVSELGLRDSTLMPGFVANPYAYMARAATYVLSSKWEGLPTVLIEALACGAPVVSTDCPSGPREALQGGKYGRLVPVGDADALARAIEASLKDGRSATVKGDWADFHVDHATLEYEKVLLDGGPSTGRFEG